MIELPLLEPPSRVSFPLILRYVLSKGMYEFSLIVLSFLRPFSPRDRLSFSLSVPPARLFYGVRTSWVESSVAILLVEKMTRTSALAVFLYFVQVIALSLLLHHRTGIP